MTPSRHQLFIIATERISGMRMEVWQKGIGICREYVNWREHWFSIILHLMIFRDNYTGLPPVLGMKVAFLTLYVCMHVQRKSIWWMANPNI